MTASQANFVYDFSVFRTFFPCLLVSACFDRFSVLKSKIPKFKSEIRNLSTCLDLKSKMASTFVECWRMKIGELKLYFAQGVVASEKRRPRWWSLIPSLPRVRVVPAMKKMEKVKLCEKSKWSEIKLLPYTEQQDSYSFYTKVLIGKRTQNVLQFKVDLTVLHHYRSMASGTS